MSIIFFIARPLGKQAQNLDFLKTVLYYVMCNHNSRNLFPVRKSSPVQIGLTCKRGKIMSKTECLKCEAKTARRRVEFVIAAGPGHESVGLAGSFNDWDPAKKQLVDKKGDGVYRGILMLPPGEYEYKFVVDGKWCIDENNPCLASNDLGTLNSVIKVEAK